QQRFHRASPERSLIGAILVLYRLRADVTGCRSASKSRSAAAPSLWRSQGEGWGGVGSAAPVEPSHARLEPHRESLCRAWLGTTFCPGLWPRRAMATNIADSGNSPAEPCAHDLWPSPPGWAAATLARFSSPVPNDAQAPAPVPAVVDRFR